MGTAGLHARLSRESCQRREEVERLRKEHEKEMPQRVCGTSSRYDQAKEEKERCSYDHQNGRDVKIRNVRMLNSGS